MAAMLPEQALELVLSHCQRLDTSEVLPIALCSGRVLGEDLRALLAHPPQRISAMDGFAVRAAEASKGARLRVIGQNRAGAQEITQLSKEAENQAVQIFTGAALPELADAIVIDELCDLENSRGKNSNSEQYITLREAPVLGRYIRAAGADFSQGATLLKKNKILSLRDVALAATMNYAWLKVRRKPVVSIVASGDELALPGEARGKKQIAAANSLMLAMLVEKLGGLPRVIPFAKDSLESLKNAFCQALQGTDLLVASGGASKSNADWVGNVIEELGIKQIFSELAMRPGKPTRFALTQSTLTQSTLTQSTLTQEKLNEGVPILVLPGNPASVFVGAMVFMRPMLRKMLNLEEQSKLARYPLKNKLGRGGARSHYMRAHLANGQVEVFDDQESAHTLTLARANCLAVQPVNAPAKDKGEEIEVLEIPEGL